MSLFDKLKQIRAIGFATGRKLKTLGVVEVTSLESGTKTKVDMALFRSYLWNKTSPWCFVCDCCNDINILLVSKLYRCVQCKKFLCSNCITKDCCGCSQDAQMKIWYPDGYRARDDQILKKYIIALTFFEDTIKVEKASCRLKRLFRFMFVAGSFNSLLKKLRAKDQPQPPESIPATKIRVTRPLTAHAYKQQCHGQHFAYTKAKKSRLGKKATPTLGSENQPPPNVPSSPPPLANIDEITHLKDIKSICKFLREKGCMLKPPKKTLQVLSQRLRELYAPMHTKRRYSPVSKYPLKVEEVPLCC